MFATGQRTPWTMIAPLRSSRPATVWKPIPRATSSRVQRFVVLTKYQSPLGPLR